MAEFKLKASERDFKGNPILDIEYGEYTDKEGNIKTNSFSMGKRKWSEMIRVFKDEEMRSKISEFTGIDLTGLPF
jgi:hypothetical protein